MRILTKKQIRELYNSLEYLYNKDCNIYLQSYIQHSISFETDKIEITKDESDNAFIITARLSIMNMIESYVTILHISHTCYNISIDMDIHKFYEYICTNLIRIVNIKNFLENE